MPKNNESRMTFIEHLGELRTRIVRTGLAIVAGFVLCYACSDQIFNVVAQPLRPFETARAVSERSGPSPQRSAEALDLLREVLVEGVDPGSDQAGETLERLREALMVKEEAGSRSQGPQWFSGNPLEPFLVKLKLAAYGGLLLALPILLYQACAFVFPGLTAREKKAARILVFGCSSLAIVGVAVAYFAIFPLVLPYLLEWAPDLVATQLRMNETVTVILKGLVAFALAFQFPMAVLVLVYMDLLSPATLKKYRRVAVVVLAVAAAMLTPPDPLSMVMMMLPLYLLYEMSIWASYLVVRRRRKEAEGAS